MSFIDQVVIEVNERWTVAVSKDSIKGIVIQVIRVNPQMVTSDKGQLVRKHEPVVMAQAIIPLRAGDAANSAFKPKQELETQVMEEINSAQLYALKCSKMETQVDEILKNLEVKYGKRSGQPTTS